MTEFIQKINDDYAKFYKFRGELKNKWDKKLRKKYFIYTVLFMICCGALIAINVRGRG